MQLASIAPADMMPISSAPTHDKEFGPVLLYDAGHGGFIIGCWEPESAAWWNQQYDTRLSPSRWLLLLA